MANYVRFNDALNFSPIGITEEIKDYYNKTTDNAKPLIVRIAATHSGKITRNNGFYLPNKMRDGAKSFLTNFNKPIQIHHNDKQDPIGRVLEAKYIDISEIQDSFVKDYFQSTDKIILDSLMHDRLSQEDTIKFAQRIINDTKLVKNPDYEGLGYIELIASITDTDAISKILDGRYLTGSTGASTDSAICSICEHNWATDGRCKDHIPGKEYDGKQCILIAGNLTYDEFSFVNKPADVHSRVIEVNVNGIQDFVQITDSPYEIQLLSKSDMEGSNMTFKQAIDLARANEQLAGLENLEDKVKQLVDSDENITEEKLVTALLASQDNTTKENELSIEDQVKAFWGDEYEDIVGDDEWGKEYAEMMSLDPSLKDAKLSAKQRKGLSKSTFCKPSERKYPVPDCAHAKSAMAYAKKYNESSSVLACIRRKASRLGCPFKDEAMDNNKDIKDFTVQDFDHYEDKEIAAMWDALQEVIVERKLECGCKEADKTQPEQLQKQLDASRKEVKYLHTDIEELMDTISKLTDQLRNDKINHLETIMKLQKQTADGLQEKSVKDLDILLKDAYEKFDIDKITDNLNSGLTNNAPIGTVEDPTLVDNNVSKSTLTDADKNRLRLHWMQISSWYGEKKATDWLEDACKQQNIDIKDIIKL